MGRLRRRRGGRSDEEERLETGSSGTSAAGAHLPAHADEAADRLLREAGPDPEMIARQLGAADPASQTRALERLQRSRGNGFVLGVVRAMRAGARGRSSAAGVGAGLTHATTLTLERSAGDASGRIDVQRDEEEGAEALDVAAATGATEAIGPAVSSTWAVTASSLADAASVIGARDEAGHVDWALSMDYAAPKGPIETVSVTAVITLEMPAWTPPSKMLPKAKAEWNRAYAALLAHEQGHIDLVHASFDGLAKSMLGKSAAVGKKMFADAKAKLAGESKAYDKSTDHGRKAGTVIDVSIEDAEIAEDKKKEDATKKDAGAGPSGAVPEGGTAPPEGGAAPG